MDDNSIPNGEEQNVQAGVDQLPEQGSEASAEQSTKTTEENGASQGEPSKDDSSSDVAGSDDLTVWAEKQGIDLDNPTPEQTKTLAKRLRDTQAGLHDKSKQAKDAQALRQAQESVSSLEGNDDLTDEELRELRRDNDIALIRAAQVTRDFYDEHPEARDYDKVMAQLILDEKEKRGAAAAQYLASDLGRLLTLAKAESAQSTEQETVSKAVREERERIRKAQEAGAEQGQAQTPMKGSSKVNREWIANTYDSSNPEHVQMLDDAIARGDLY